MKTHHALSTIGLSLISIGLHAQIERLTLRDYALSGHGVRQVAERNYRYDAKQDSEYLLINHINYEADT